jgi:hypothetical protein
VKLLVIRALFWMIRTFKFDFHLEDGPMVYNWRLEDGKVVDYFESPTGHGLDGHHVCCVLRTEGFFRLAWAILTQSKLTTGYWLRTFNTDRAEDYGIDWPGYTECRCQPERSRAERLKDVVFIDISKVGSCQFNPRYIGIIWEGCKLRPILQPGDGRGYDLDVLSFQLVDGKWPHDSDLITIARGWVPSPDTPSVIRCGGRVKRKRAKAQVTIYTD